MIEIDKDIIDTRAVNAARNEIAEWEAQNRVVLTKHERKLFLFAFLAGMEHGVREAIRTQEP